jgi:hypothetical protein
MIPAERNYEVHDQELLAIIESFRHWRHYLEGSAHPVEVLTDHNNLKHFQMTTQLSRRQVRWSQVLSAFNLVLNYRKGTLNPADGPSRRPDYANATDQDVIMTEAPALLRMALQPHNPQELRDEVGSREETDPSYHSREGNREGADSLREEDKEAHVFGVFELEVQSVQDRARKIFIAGTSDEQETRSREEALSAAEEEDPFEKVNQTLAERLPGFLRVDPLAQNVIRGLANPEGSILKDTLPNWTQDGELLYYHRKLYIPACEALRIELLKKNHDNPLAGHFATERTYDLLQRKYFWPAMKKFTREYCDTCTVCQGSRVSRGKQYGKLQPLPIPAKRNERISLDFITDLPASKSYEGTEYNALCVLVEALSKKLTLVPCRKDITAQQLAGLFMVNIVKHNGAPQEVVSDRGPQFTSEFWAELLYQLKVERKLSTAFHPQTDGQTERNNSTIEQYIRCYTNYEQDDWVRLIPLAEFAYNSAKHSSTGMAPFEVIYGRESMPECEFLSREEAARLGQNASAESFADRMREALDYCKEALAKAQRQQKEQYDKRRKDVTFQIGQKVWLSLRNIHTDRPARKFDWRNIGPCRIIDKIGKIAYQLELPAGLRIHDVFHVSLLREHRQRKGERTPSPQPIRLKADESKREFVVGEIVDSRVQGNKLQYRVRWKGYQEDEDTWEPALGLKKAQKAVSKFHKEYPNKPSLSTITASKEKPSRGRPRGRGRRN